MRSFGGRRGEHGLKISGRAVSALIRNVRGIRVLWFSAFLIAVAFHFASQPVLASERLYVGTGEYSATRDWHGILRFDVSDSINSAVWPDATVNIKSSKDASGINLNFGHTMWNSSNDSELYVGFLFTTADNRTCAGTSDTCGSIAVFSNPQTMNGPQTPSRHIIGVNTKIKQPHGIWVDESRNLLYAANTMDSGILIWKNAKTVNGNTAPDTVIVWSKGDSGAGDRNLMGAPVHVFVDTSSNLLFAACMTFGAPASKNAVLIWKNASHRNGGNDTPDYRITGFNTFLDSGNNKTTHNVWFDTDRQLLFVGHHTNEILIYTCSDLLRVTPANKPYDTDITPRVLMINETVSDTYDWSAYGIFYLSSRDRLYISAGYTPGGTSGASGSPQDPGSSKHAVRVYDSASLSYVQGRFTPTRTIQWNNSIAYYPPQPVWVSVYPDTTVTTPRTWYVNDTYSSTTDSFTYAGGSDTGGAGSANLPFRSAGRAMKNVRAGDTIYIDAGLYDSYVPVSSTETAGFKIDTDNLTIIGKDSNSTIIDPPGASTVNGLYGIYADTQKNLVIKNLGITGANNGIQFVNVDLSTLTGDSVSSCGNDGIHLRDGSDTTTVSNNTVRSNGFMGIEVISSFNDTVLGNLVVSQPVVGIIFDGCQNGLVSNNTSQGNSQGIELSTCTGMTVLGNTVVSNTSEGFTLFSAFNNQFRNNVSKLNMTTGVAIISSSGNMFVQNTFDSNLNYQISIDQNSSSDTFIKNNIRTSTNNGDSAVSNTSTVGSNKFSFTRNYWGTVDEAALRRMVIGAPAGVDSVVFIPYRFGPVDTTAGADTTAPGLPVGVTLDTISPNMIKLTWTIPTINEETNGGTFSYNGAKIYRLVNSPDTTYWSNSSLLVRISSSTETTWTDTQVVNGNIYYYRMTSLDTAAFANQSFFTDTKATALNVVVTCTGGETLTVVAGDTFEKAWKQKPDTAIPKVTSTSTILDGSVYRTYWVNLGNVVTDTSTTGDSFGREVTTGVKSGSGSLEGFIRNPAVWKFASNDYLMIYEALETSGAGIMRFFRATSTDGVTFTKKYDGLFDSGAVMIPGPDETGFISVPDLHVHNGYLYIYYVSGGNYSAVARSSDTGRTWAKLGKIMIEGLPAGHKYVDPDVITDSHGRRILFFAYDNGSGVFGKGGIRSAVAKCDTHWVLQNGARVMPEKSTDATLDPDVTPVFGKNGVYRVQYGLGNPNANQYDLMVSTYDTATIGSVWYVNDTSTVGDSFTTAFGADTNAGNFPYAPLRTIPKAMSLAKSGDTIYIDAGLYDSYVNVTSTETAGFKIDTDNLTIIGKDSNATVIVSRWPSTTAGVYGIYADTQTGLAIKSLGVLGAYDGIRFYNVDLSALNGDSVSSCNNVGIYLLSGSDSNTLINNFANSNNYGFYLTGSNETVANNMASANTQSGITLDQISGSVVKNNTVNSSSQNGIILLTSPNNLIIGNTLKSNTRAGLYFSSSDTNTAIQNDIIGSDTGIQIIGAARANTFTKNNVTGHTYVVYNTSGAAQTLMRNWWGTTSEDSINAMWSDTSSTYRPYRFGPVDTGLGADTTAPFAPVSVTFDTTAAGVVKLTWTIPTVSEETNGGTVGYAGAKIYRLKNRADTTNWASSLYLAWTASSTDTTWTDTAVTMADTFYYRLTSFDAATFPNQSFFTDTKATRLTDTSPKTWYVNDTYSSTADSFTYAGGSDTSGADGSRNAPFRSPARAMQSVKAGDTVFIDAGFYDSFVAVVAGSETAAFKIDTDKITIIGKDSASTIIDPPGANTTAGLYGMYADTQTGLTIKNIGITGAYDGIKLVNVDLSTLTGDSACSTGDIGIYLLDGSETNTVSKNTANSNTNYGILAGSGSNGNTLDNNITNSNLQYGIALSSSFNTVSNNTANSNTGNGYGIHLSPNANNNILTSNTANSNTAYGILVVNGSSNNVVANNITLSNSQCGIQLQTNANGNIVRNNISKSNVYAGIRIQSSDTNTIVQNDVSASDSGIWIDGSSRNNTVVKNNVSGNNVNYLYNQTGLAQQTFARNWFGTTDEVTIAAKFTDTANNFRPYRLTTVDTIAGADTTAPLPPVGVAVDTTTAGVVKLTWTIPTVNEETNGGAVGYTGAKIYRIKNLVDTTNWGNSVNLVWTAGASDTSWTDTTVVAGTTYYYRLTSFDAATFVNESFFTDTKWASASSLGSVRVFEDAAFTDDVDTYLTRDVMYVEVRDTDENKNGAAVETVTVTVTIGNGTTEGDAAGLVLDTEKLVLTESGANTAIFRTAAVNVFDTKVPLIGDGGLSWGRADTLHASYIDANDTTDFSSDTALALEIASLVVGASPTGFEGFLYEDIAFTDLTDTYVTRDVVRLQVQDTDENRNPQRKDTIFVTVYIGNNTNAAVTDTEIIVLTETTETSGVFRSPDINLTDTVGSIPNNGFLTWATSDTLHVSYVDVTGGTTDSGNDTALLVDTAAQANTGPFWYVNDTSTAGDLFTSAQGSDTSGVGTATSPYRSVAKAIRSVKAGDTIFVDAGYYTDTYMNVNTAETAAIRIDTDFLSIIGKDSNLTIIDPPGANSVSGLYGIYADTQKNLLIKNLGVTGANNGIQFVNVDLSSVTSDSVSSCGNDGIVLRDGSDTNTVSNSTVRSNGVMGINVISSFNDTVLGNLVVSQTVVGIIFDGSQNGLVSNNTSQSNSQGIELSTCTGMTVLGNTVVSNTTEGFTLFSAFNNQFRNNVSKLNMTTGVAIFSSSGNMFVQNTFDSNLNYQISVDQNSSSDTFIKNTIRPSTNNPDSGVSNTSTVGSNKFSFTRNWWYTTDEVAIKKMVSGASAGADSITFIPYRIGSVDTAAGADTTAPLPVVSVTLDTTTAGTVKVSWTIPTVNEETNGGSVSFAGVNIWRLTNLVDTTNWANPLNLAFQTAAADTSWTDTTVTGGSTYYYRITSKDSATIFNESFFTDTKSIKPDSVYTGPKWYVNDTYSSSIDSFTYAGGSDTSGGDGSTTKPFRSAAKALQKAKSGDTIYIDAGLYSDTYVTVSSTETAAFKIDTDNLAIIGKDSYATVIDPPGDSRVRNLYGIYSSGRKNLTLKNIGVTGAGYGIYFVNVKQSTISGDSAGTIGFYGIALGSGSETTLVTNSAASFADSYGIYFQSATSCSVTNNVATSNGIQGIYMNLSKNIAITGNTAGSNSNGCGIFLEACSSTIISNNTLSSNSCGVELYSGSTNMLITGNTILSNSGDGVIFDSSPNNMIRNNTIKSNVASGIRILNSDTNAIFQNEIWSNDTGVRFTGSSVNNLVTKNNIRNNTTRNIHNEGGLAQVLTRNWWNTTDETTILGLISDTASSFRPYRLGQVDTTAGADTTAPGLPASVTLDTSTAAQIKVTWVIPTVNEETNGGTISYAGAKIYRLKNTIDTTNWGNSTILVWTSNATDTTWNDTNVTAGSTYYYRLSSFDGSAAANQSFFTDTKWAVAQAAGTTAVQKWYVNDTYATGDSFTYAGGSDTGGTGSTTAPFRSAAKALQSAKSGDTIVIDAGYYGDTYVTVSSTETAAFKIDTDYISIIGKDSNATVIDPPGLRSMVGLYGIYASNRAGLLIKNLGVTGAQRGIYLNNVDSSIITGDSVSLNDSYGINLQSGCESVWINANTTESNAHSGIQLFGCYRILISNNLAGGNGSGILVDASDTNQISGNTCNSNRGAGTLDDPAGVGIELVGGSSFNLVTGNTTNSNVGLGINVGEGASKNMIRNNLIRSNTWLGIRIDNSESNVVTQNDISGGDTGILLERMSRFNVITKNVISGSAVNFVYSFSARDSGLAQSVFSRNWFGTTDEVAIAARFVDTASAFRPYRFAQADTAAGADTTAPGLQTSVALDTSTAGQIKVTWVIPTINEETNGGAVGYAGAKIYRLTSSIDTTNWANSAILVRTSSSTETTWSDTLVTAAVSYCYRLTSIDAATYVNQSFFTDTKCSLAPSSAAATGARVDSVTIDSGNHQLGTISTRLTYPLRVRLTDSAGSPVAYSNVKFAVAYPSGGAAAYFGSSSTKTTDSALTDTNGYVSDTFTLGTSRGIYRVTATSDSNTGKSATFTLYADGIDISAAAWKMVTPNKSLSSSLFSTFISAVPSAIGYKWNENAGVSAGLSDYVKLGSTDALERARSYWIYSTSAGSITPSGAADLATVTVALTAGWHMIGSGQYFYVDWDSGVTFDTNGTTYYPAQAAGKGIMNNTIYWYTGSGYYWGPDAATPALSRVQMKPMVGFWIFTAKACTMTVYPNPVSPQDTSTQILAQAPFYSDGGISHLAAKYADGGSEADWTLRLTAASGSQSDFQNYVGVKPSAQDAAKAAVYDPPAAAGNYVALGIVDADGARRAASYSEPITTVKAWTVSVASDLDTQVTLAWENVASIPEKYGAYVIGGQNGPVDMRKKSSMVLSAPSLNPQSSNLILAVGLPDYLAPYLAASLDKSQSFVYPNPGPDGTTGSMSFKYNLQSAADVTIRIFDVGGKLARELKQSGIAGSNTLTWDTTNKNGQKLGSGVYIYILQSGSTKLVDKLAIVR